MTVYDPNAHWTGVYTSETGGQIRARPVNKLVQDLAEAGLIACERSPTEPTDPDVVWLRPSSGSGNGDVLIHDGTTWTDSRKDLLLRHLGGLTSAQITTLLAGKAASVHTHSQSDITNLVSDLAAKAPLASPPFTGSPTAPTAAVTDNSTLLATTAHVRAATYADVHRYGAKGDGVYVTTGTATNGDATFTATGVTWTSADIGKSIVIAGAGSAGATLSTTIASINTTTSIELTDAPSTTVSGTAKFYYGTDDTTALQAAIDATSNYGGVGLRPLIYMASNLKTKTDTKSAGFVQKGFFGIVGTAAIVAIGSGSSAYLMASERWVSNNPFADSPWHFSSVKFEAFGLKDACFVHKMFKSVVENCEFANPRVVGYRLTRQNSDATLGTTSYLFKNHLRYSEVNVTLPGLSPSFGIDIEGTAADATDSATDGTLTNTEVYGTTGTSVFGVGVRFGNTGGWTATGNRTWACTEGLSILQFGKNFTTGQNNWDCDSGVAARLGKVGTYIDFASIKNDTFYADVMCDFSDDGTTEVIEIANCGFWFDPQQPSTGIGADGQARIVHNNNRASKTIRSRGNFFQAENAHQRAVGNTLGVLDVEGHFSVEDAVNYARRVMDSGSTGVVDRSLHDSASPAASDILNTQIYVGRDSAGNLTDYVQTEALITDPTNGSEDAAWRVRAFVGGTLTQRFRLDETGCWVGAGNTMVPSAGQVGFGVIGTGYTTSGQSWSRYSADADGPWLITFKSRGASIGTNTVVNSGDALARIQVRAADGSASLPAAQIRFEVDGTPGASDMPGRILLMTTADGASSETEQLRIANTGAVSHRANATVVIDASSHLGLRSYTVGTLPSASTPARMIYVSDGTSNKRLAVSDGTNWRFPDGNIVS